MECFFCGGHNFTSAGVFWDEDLGVRMEMWRCDACGGEHGANEFRDDDDDASDVVDLDEISGGRK